MPNKLFSIIRHSNHGVVVLPLPPLTHTAWAGWESRALEGFGLGAPTLRPLTVNNLSFGRCGEWMKDSPYSPEVFLHSPAWLKWRSQPSARWNTPDRWWGFFFFFFLSYLGRAGSCARVRFPFVLFRPTPPPPGLCCAPPLCMSLVALLRLFILHFRIHVCEWVQHFRTDQHVKQKLFPASHFHFLPWWFLLCPTTCTVPAYLTTRGPCPWTVHSVSIVLDGCQILVIHRDRLVKVARRWKQWRVKGCGSFRQTCVRNIISSINKSNKVSDNRPFEGLKKKRL